MPVRHVLEVIDDLPIQIFVAKAGENPAGWAVPVQRVLTVLKPLHAPTLRGTAERVVRNYNRIQLSHSPAITELRMAALSSPKKSLTRLTQL